MLVFKRLAVILGVTFASISSFGDQPRTSSLYIDTIAVPLMLIAERGSGVYGLGLGADWHLNRHMSIGSSLNQWGYIGALAVSRLAFRSHYFFSDYQNSGFYTTLSLAHWKATEEQVDCKKTVSEFRLGGMAGYQIRFGKASFARLGIGATTGEYMTEPCFGREMGTPTLGEVAIGFNF
jgi:hypothetical protein